MMKDTISSYQTWYQAEAPMVDVARDQRWGRVAEGGVFSGEM